MRLGSRGMREREGRERGHGGRESLETRLAELTFIPDQFSQPSQ